MGGSESSVTDSEIRTRVVGVDATMGKFTFLFGLVLAEKLLQHTDILSKTLQAPSLTASEGQKIADLTCKTLGRIRSTEAFDLFWERVQQLQSEFGVNNACFPRKRKSPRHLEVGESPGYYPRTPKEYYSQQCFECIDYVISSIKECFNQPGYRVLQGLENLLLKAAKGENYQK